MSGATGWPWTEEPPELPAVMPDGRSWPRITVVTPSYNQAAFLEETVRSVLLQGYPNLEYLVLDGGSTDGSLAIVERYSPWIDWWTAGPDAGQSDAIQSGLDRASGEIFNWINSDDLLLPGALRHVAENFGAGVDAVAGAGRFFGEDFDSWVLQNEGLSARALVRGATGPVFVQPALWLRTDAVTAAGGIDRELNYYFDMDMTIRYLAGHANVAYTARVLAAFRLHGVSKTMAANHRFREEYRIALRKLAEWPGSRVVRRMAARRLEELALHESVRQLLGDGSAGRWVSTGRLAALAARHPRPGALKICTAALARLVRGRPWFEDDGRSLPVWAEPHYRGAGRVADGGDIDADSGAGGSR